MKKRLLYFFLLFVTLANFTFAQDQSLGENDPEAKEILDKVSQKYKSYTSLKTGFSMIVIDMQDEVLSDEKGDFWLKGEMYKFKIGGVEVFSKDRTVWNYSKENNEVQITDYEPESGEITPSSLFTDFYDKDFLYRLNGKKEVQGQSVHEIELTPTNKSMPYFKVLAWIDTAKDQITGMKIFYKGGHRFEYLFHSYEPNVPLEAADFTFDKKDFPGVEVVDLRM